MVAKTGLRLKSEVECIEDFNLSLVLSGDCEFYLVMNTMISWIMLEVEWNWYCNTLTVLKPWTEISGYR